MCTLWLVMFLLGKLVGERVERERGRDELYWLQDLGSCDLVGCCLFWEVAREVVLEISVSSCERLRRERQRERLDRGFAEVKDRRSRKIRTASFTHPSSWLFSFSRNTSASFLLTLVLFIACYLLLYIDLSSSFHGMV